MSPTLTKRQDVKPTEAIHLQELIPLSRISTLRTEAINPRPAASVPRELDSLIDSIRTNGLLHPIVVVRAGDLYELVAGQRRLAALQVLRQTNVNAVVLPDGTTDDDARAYALIENLQREELSPLDEAAAIARLQTTTDDASIALKIGKPGWYVARRSSLNRLTDEWRNALANGTLSLNAAMVVARYTPEQQQQIAGAFLEEGMPPGHATATTLASYAASRLQADLQRAVFPLDVEVGGCQACVTCPKRAANASVLFPDIAIDKGHDPCTDRACFDAKTSATVEQRVRELVDKHGDDVVLITTSYSAHADVLGRPVLHGMQYSKAKKSTKGAKLALVVDGYLDTPAIGSTIYVVPERPRAPRGKSATDTKQERESRKAQRVKENLEKAAHVRVQAKLVAEAKWSPSFAALLVAAVLEHVLRFNDEIDKALDAAGLAKPKRKKSQTLSEWGLSEVAHVIAQGTSTQAARAATAALLATASTRAYHTDAEGVLARLFGVDLKPVRAVPGPKQAKLAKTKKGGKR